MHRAASPEMAGYQAELILQAVEIGVDGAGVVGDVGIAGAEITARGTEGDMNVEGQGTGPPLAQLPQGLFVTLGRHAIEPDRGGRRDAQAGQLAQVGFKGKRMEVIQD